MDGKEEGDKEEGGKGPKKSHVKRKCITTACIACRQRKSKVL